MEVMRQPLQRGYVETIGPYGLHRSTLPVDASQGLLDVQLARLALRVAAVPIEQAEGGVARLLDFRQEHAVAHGMNRPGRQEDAIAGTWLKMMQAIGNRSLRERLVQLSFINAGQQAGIHAASRRGSEHEPGFGLASLARPKTPHPLLVRVHLYRQPVTGV